MARERDVVEADDAHLARQIDADIAEPVHHPSAIASFAAKTAVKSRRRESSTAAR
jgi:hypothetical protein